MLNDWKSHDDETIILTLDERSSYTKNAKNIASPVVGNWYSFPGNSFTIYGKVASRKGNEVTLEKHFELPNYRPFAEIKWFDKLPRAVAD